jgi:hypothetical protein
LELFFFHCRPVGITLALSLSLILSQTHVSKVLALSLSLVSRPIDQEYQLRPAQWYLKPNGFTFKTAVCGSQDSNPFTAGRIFKNAKNLPNPAYDHPYIYPIK